MNARIKELGRFGFHFATATYLLALPIYALFNKGDWLLPYEAALCVSLAVLNGGLSVRSAWRAIT